MQLCTAYEALATAAVSALVACTVADDRGVSEIERDCYIRLLHYYITKLEIHRAESARERGGNGGRGGWADSCSLFTASSNPRAAASLGCCRLSAQGGPLGPPKGEGGPLPQRRVLMTHF